MSFHTPLLPDMTERVVLPGPLNTIDDRQGETEKQDSGCPGDRVGATFPA